MKTLTARLRAWLRSRTGRLVVHDVALAAAAAAAVLEGAHNVDAGVLKAASVVALKVLLRLVLPVPAGEPMPAASAEPIAYTAPRPRPVTVPDKPTSKVIVIPEFHSPDGGRLGRHINHDPRSRDFPVVRRAARRTSVRHPRHVPTYDQGELGDCVPHAGKGVLSTAPFRRRFTSEHGIITTYIELTAADDIPGYYKPGDPNSQDTGSDGLSFAKLAVRKRWCSSYRHAFTIDQALDALQVTAVMTGVNWYEGMDRPDEDGLVGIAGAARGAHEFEVDEYRQRGTVPNIHEDLVGCEQSWGPGWGAHGRFYLTVATWAQLLEQQGDVTVLVP